MLEPKTITGKKIISRDGEDYLDLVTSSLKFGGDIPRIERRIFVNQDTEMRIDAISQIVYEDQNKFDFILKYNGISNPYSIQSGDLLLIPNSKDMANNFIKPTSEEDKTSLKEKLLDPTKFSKKDQKRIEFLKKKAEQVAGQAAPDELVTPNLAKDGAQEIKVKDGKIVFGDDVVGNIESCPEPLSRASLKAKLLANKIFRNT